VETGSYGYLLKPFNERELKIAVDLALVKHRTDKAEREAREEWKTTFDMVPDLIMIVDRDYRITRANRAMAERIGLPSQELIGSICYKLVHGTDIPPVLCPHTGVLEKGEKHMVEVCEEKMGGDFIVSCTPIRDASGVITGSVHVARDITKRVRGERRLKEDLALLQSVIDGTPESMVVVDKNFRVVMLNAAARRNAVREHSEEDPVGRYCYKVCHGVDEPCSGADHPYTGKPVTVVHAHRRTGDTLFPAEIVAAPLYDGEGRFSGIVEVGRDISERLELEKERERFKEECFERKREESIVTLAGGLAHDFNNLLTPVIGNAELIRAGADPDGRVSGMTERIIQSGVRMAELTQQLLAFAKRGKYQPALVYANQVVADVFDRFREKLKDNIAVKLELPPGEWMILVDVQQMNLLIKNLLENAREAVEDGGGRIVVAVVNEAHNELWRCTGGHEHAPGRYIRMTVKDSGPGISPEELVRAFDPFYTTKTFGRGLGLSAAKGIAENHGGCLALTSRQGEGACAHIVLPEAGKKTVSQLRERRETERPTGPRRVLVIDDEEAVRDLLESVLKHSGFSVTSESGGFKAIETFQKEPDSFALVLLDIHMPGVGGKTYIPHFSEVISVNLSKGADA
jgi:PAS domain S-box-containing protein